MGFLLLEGNCFLPAVMYALLVVAAVAAVPSIPAICILPVELEAVLLCEHPSADVCRPKP